MSNKVNTLFTVYCDIPLTVKQAKHMTDKNLHREHAHTKKFNTGRAQCN